MNHERLLEKYKKALVPNEASEPELMGDRTPLGDKTPYRALVALEAFPPDRHLGNAAANDGHHQAGSLDPLSDLVADQLRLPPDDDETPPRGSDDDPEPVVQTIAAPQLVRIVDPPETATRIRAMHEYDLGKEDQAWLAARFNELVPGAKPKPETDHWNVYA